MFLSTWDAGYRYTCADYTPDSRKDPKEQRVANVMWWYFISKAIELMDTVLMVLRKKNNQITFLHWFHHASMLNIWWWVMTFIPGGQSFFGSGLNCLVHVVMYLYYGLAAVPSLKEKLWWKRYITRFQLIQFAITLTHSMSSYRYLGHGGTCQFPIWGINLLAGYMILMLSLFSNFYIRTYIQKGKHRAVEKSMSNGINGAARATSAANGANGHIAHTKEN